MDLTPQDKMALEKAFEDRLDNIIKSSNEIVRHTKKALGADSGADFYRASKKVEDEIFKLNEASDILSKMLAQIKKADATPAT